MMMNKNELNTLKIELLQAIIECNDEAVLQEIKQLLRNLYVKEGSESYLTQEPYSIPLEHYEKLEKDIKLFEEGKLKTYSLDEVKSNIQKKYGF